MKPSFAARGGWWVVAQGGLIAAGLAAGPLGAAEHPAVALRVIGGVLMAAGAGFGVAGVLALGQGCIKLINWLA